MKHEAGTWEWDGSFSYGTQVLYTCGPYGNFQRPDGSLYEYLVSTCTWDRTWYPPVLEPCAATSCQLVPFPPKDTGLVHLPDSENPITLESEFTIYDVTLPQKMNFPGDFCGGEGRIMLVVGRFPLESRHPLEIVFRGAGKREAFHVLVDPGDQMTQSVVDNLTICPVQELIQRWAVLEDSSVELVGDPGDGTTIDLDEPFLLR